MRLAGSSPGRLHARPAARRSGAPRAVLGVGGASPRDPARCAAAAQKQSSGSSDAMAGSERPSGGPGSAGRSGRTPAGLAGAGAEGGGGTRPQAPPRPGHAPPGPREAAASEPAPWAPPSVRPAAPPPSGWRASLVAARWKPLLQPGPPPALHVGTRGAAGRASWNHDASGGPLGG